MCTPANSERTHGSLKRMRGDGLFILALASHVKKQKYEFKGLTACYRMVTPVRLKFPFSR
jgi:hypothetical protein